MSRRTIEGLHDERIAVAQTISSWPNWLGVIAVMSALLVTPRHVGAQAGGWIADPAPSASSGGPKTGTEQTHLTYQITGQDKDTYTNTEGTQFQVGDRECALFGGTVESGEIVNGPEVSASDPDNGKYTWDITVNLKSVQQTETVSDSWAVGDNRGDFDTRHDQTPTGVTQTITINNS